MFQPQLTTFAGPYGSPQSSSPPLPLYSVSHQSSYGLSPAAALDFGFSPLLDGGGDGRPTEPAAGAAAASAASAAAPPPRPQSLSAPSQLPTAPHQLPAGAAARQQLHRLQAGNQEGGGASTRKDAYSPPRAASTTNTSRNPQLSNSTTAPALHHSHARFGRQHQQQDFSGRGRRQPLPQLVNEEPRQPQLRHTLVGSAAPTMADHDQHGMEAQQVAAKDYQPMLDGPLVGDRTPSHAITNEYAKADPVYVDKTIALPQTYSHYRPIQGDGNCGWRAIGFSYFEKLVEAGDQAQVEGEVARLTSLNQMLESVGGYTYFEDFADEAIGLLREIASSMSNPAVAHMLLHQRWNDTGITNGIIYYLRLLAATYLKAKPELYEPFISDGLGVHGYCSQNIELVNREIEHLGIDGLANILLKPVNFVLEIAYLDRSPGGQVNSYRFPKEANGQDVAALGPIIYLLYRPDHYDILYRNAPTSPPPASVSMGPVNMQVNRVSSLSLNATISNPHGDLGAFATADLGALAMLPGFSPAVSDMSPMASPAASVPPPSVPSPMAESFSPMQQNPWMMRYPVDLQTATSQASPQQAHVVAQPPPMTPSTPMSSSPLASNPPPMVSGSAMSRQGSLAHHGNSLAPPEAGYHIRFSPVQLEYDETQSAFQEPFQVTTSTFKNSVYNRAHFGNPDFHPEEWCPDDEGGEARMSGKKKCRKDS